MKTVKLWTFLSNFTWDYAQIQLSLIYSRSLSYFTWKSQIRHHQFDWVAHMPTSHVFPFCLQWKRLARQQILFKLLVFRKRSYLKSIPLTLEMAKIPLTTGLLNPSPVKVKACYRVYLCLFSVCMHVYLQNIFRYN